MTAKQLAEALLKYPPDLEVVVRADGDELIRINAHEQIPVVKCNNPEAPNLLFDADFLTPDFQVIVLS